MAKKPNKPRGPVSIYMNLAAENPIFVGTEEEHAKHLKKMDIKRQKQQAHETKTKELVNNLYGGLVKFGESPVQNHDTFKEHTQGHMLALLDHTKSNKKFKEAVETHMNRAQLDHLKSLGLKEYFGGR